MRVIKFRGKSNYNNWVTGSLLIDNYNNHFIINHDQQGVKNCVDVIPETVGQFTGLSDKNGKDIYDGDV